MASCADASGADVSCADASGAGVSCADAFSADAFYADTFYADTSCADTGACCALTRPRSCFDAGLPRGGWSIPADDIR